MKGMIEWFARNGVAANLMMVFIVVSGIYLWWPRRWSMQNLKSIVLFRGGLSGKARDFNWHNVIGVWSMIPLFFVVFNFLCLKFRKFRFKILILLGDFLC